MSCERRFEGFKCEISDKTPESHAACSPWLHKSAEPTQSRRNKRVAPRAQSSRRQKAGLSAIAHCIKPVQRGAAAAFQSDGGGALVAAASARAKTQFCN